MITSGSIAVIRFELSGLLPDNARMSAAVDASTFRPVVVAPTYNNAVFLPELIERLRRAGLPVILVNDGSSDDAADLLGRILKPGDSQFRLLHHPANRGKAAALHTGFHHALTAGFTHALTIDTDGQHDPEDIPVLLVESKEHPSALILGRRRQDLAHCPARSIVGRVISNAYIFMETGIRIADSQCGLRVYPLELIRRLRCSSQRYCFETEVITRTLWAGGRVRCVPITSRYLPDERRVSHFRPWIDTFRSIAMHIRLVARHALPWPHRKLEMFAVDPPFHSPRRDSLKHWLHPAIWLRDIRRRKIGVIATSMGLGFGTFIANLPVYGFQTLLSIAVARRFHLPPWPVVLGSQLSMPPLNVGLIAAAIHVGHWLLRGSPPDLSPLRDPEWTVPQLLSRWLLEWAVGSIIVGSVCMAATFGVAAPILWRISRGKPPAIRKIIH